jgi:hypothetical protein
MLMCGWLYRVDEAMSYSCDVSINASELGGPEFIAKACFILRGALVCTYRELL